MKKLLLLTMLLCFSLFTISCESEFEDDMDVAVEEEKNTPDDELSKSAWQNLFWDGFNSFNSNNWTKTNRQDYNSWRCQYLPQQVFTGSWQGETFLVLRAQKRNNTQWKSGHVKSKRNFRPGNNQELRFRARIKFQSFNSNGSWRPFHDSYGAWPAFWTVNETAWPTRGEIDIMEGYTFGNGSNDKYASNLFYGTQTGNNILNSNQSTQYYSGSVSGQGGWNNFEMRWENKNGWNVIRIYVNGSLKKTYTNNNVNGLRLDKFSAHNIILNLNVGANDSFNIFNNSNINMFGKTEMLIDYVQVQRRYI